MGPVFYVMTILGCADGSVQCTPVATLPTRYENEQQCKGDASQALILNSRFDFPTLVAECNMFDTRMIASSQGPKARKLRRG